MLSPTTTVCSIGTPSRSAAAMNRSGSGFAYFTSSRVTTTAFAGSTPSASRLTAAVSIRPLVAMAQRVPASRQRREQFARARQRTHLRAQPLVRLRMRATQPFDAIRADLAVRLAQQLIGEQAAAHADLAMDAPHRQLDAFVVERFLPREHVLVDAVDERAVEVEQE